MTGLADDGGLYSPNESRMCVANSPLARPGFVELAGRVMANFIDDIDADVLQALLRAQLCDFDTRT